VLEPGRAGELIDRLYRAAWALVGDPHDAEDLVQDTYAQVLSRPRFLRREDDIGYLLRALRNVHANRLRTLSRRPRSVDSETQAEPVSARSSWQPEDALDASELFTAISSLPPDARDVLVAVDVVGLSYREAGSALGIREATVTSRLHRARSRVVEVLNGDPVSERRP
jgi:RNA polymerase sigma-70 factor (ECF subfamily)